MDRSESRTGTAGLPDRRDASGPLRRTHGWLCDDHRSLGRAEPARLDESLSDSDGHPARDVLERDGFGCLRGPRLGRADGARLDRRPGPVTGKVVATIPWGDMTFEGAGCGGLWGSRTDGSDLELLRIDPGTGAQVVSWTETDSQVPRGVGGLETSDGCWLRLDPTAGSIGSRLVELTPDGPGRAVGGFMDDYKLSVVNDTLWACALVGVVRFDPDLGQTTGTAYALKAPADPSVPAGSPAARSSAPFFGAAGTYWPVIDQTGVRQRLDVAAD